MQNIEKWQSARATVVHLKMFRPIITDCDAIKQVQTSCGPETPFFYAYFIHVMLVVFVQTFVWCKIFLIGMFFYKCVLIFMLK